MFEQNISMLSFTHEGMVPSWLPMPNAARTTPIVHGGRIGLEVVLVAALRFWLGSLHAIKTEAIEMVPSRYYSAFHDVLIVLATVHTGIQGRLVRETIQSGEDTLNTLP